MVLAVTKSLEQQLMDRFNVYLTTGLALLAIAVLVWLILRIRSWFFESDDSDEPLQEMLTQFRQLKREGELTEEEYRLISQRLSAPREQVRPPIGQPPPPSDPTGPDSQSSADPATS